MPGVDLAPGTRIKQYELIRELGRGGMGVVYAARDVKLGRRVAMKFLRNIDREVLDRFLVEARATAQCNHDNIVIIYEVDEHDGMPYMVLEFLEGKTLRDVMGEFGDGSPIAASRVVELMLPVARALARAHELGIVHRDLKPENVHVTQAGQVKVLDFGIAKALGSNDTHRSVSSIMADAGASLTLTREGALVGTLPYMSPEQMGVDEIDHRSDLFSLGMIMFEMLAGRHPIEPLTSDALLANLVTSEPMRSVRGAVPDLPDGLVQVIDACLQKAKQNRIASAGELARRLERLLPARDARQLAEGESPYPGLTAFQEHDADRFFGRSRDVTRMVARVRELPLTAIVGPSGVGKSSFVRAGVGPALKGSGEAWEIITLRPGRYPIAALATVIERWATRTAGEPGNDHSMMMRRLRAEPGYFGAALRARATATNGHVLLFIDQFEELYTLVPDAEERLLFTAALAGVADDTAAPLRVVVSMRSDFLDRVAEDPRLMEELSRGLVFLSAPDRDGLREALELPVEMVGYKFESSAMVGDMLDALANTPGALPLLQFAAAKLWDARDRQRKLLTMASYQAIGGISGALATHADDVIRNMTAAQQKLTQQVFRQLVTPERTRAIVELADLHQLAHSSDEIGRVIDLLVAARLLVVQTRTDAGGSVEIVHESLIDRWPTLRRWLDEDQEDAQFISQLAAAAKQWDAKGRPAGLLWRGDAMDEARRWYSSSARTLAPRDQAFIDAVLALARRGRRTRRVALISAFTVLAAIAGGASVAYMRMNALRQEAAESLVRANEETAKANSAAAEAKAKQEQAEAADRNRKVAEQGQQQAETALKKTDFALADREQQLRQRNEELEKQQKAANLAREQAEAASKKAIAAAADAQKAKAELQTKLDEERRRVKQLEEETRKLSTKLKD